MRFNREIRVPPNLFISLEALTGPHCHSFLSDHPEKIKELEGIISGSAEAMKKILEALDA